MERFLILLTAANNQFAAIRGMPWSGRIKSVIFGFTTEIKKTVNHYSGN